VKRDELGETINIDIIIKVISMI